MADAPQRRAARRARVVADLPVDALVAQAEKLSRGWAIALIADGSLERLPSIPLGEFSREAPALCSQMLRALQSDVELDRLTGRGSTSGRERSAQALGLPVMTGASDAAATVQAVEALRGVLWEALLDELSAPTPRMLADVADRLGCVCSCALAAAVAALSPAPALSTDEGDVAATARDRDEREAAHADVVRTDAVIVDERAEVELAVSREPRVEDRSLPGGPEADDRPLSWDESPPVLPSGTRDEIEIRDERRAEGPAAWIGSIGHQLARFQDDGRPFAVLLVELLEIDSLRRGESPEELERLSKRVQDALANELRTAGPGSLTCESPGRYWLLALNTDRSEADRLAERLTHAVYSSVRHRQAPLAVVLGAAICPEDGLQAPMLAAHADVGLYAARSSARALSGPASS